MASRKKRLASTTLKMKPVERSAHALSGSFRSLYPPLGAFVAAFGGLEDQLAQTLNMLLRGMAGTAIDSLFPGFNGRVKLFHFLALRFCNQLIPVEGTGMINWPKMPGGKELAATAKTIARCLTQANNDRTDLLHNGWTAMRDSSGLSFAKNRIDIGDDGRSKPKLLHDITPDLISKEVGWIIDITWWLADWTERAIRLNAPQYVQPPLQGTLPQRSPLALLMDAHKTAERQRQQQSSPG